MIMGDFKAKGHRTKIIIQMLTLRKRLSKKTKKKRPLGKLKCAKSMESGYSKHIDRYNALSNTWKQLNFNKNYNFEA